MKSLLAVTTLALVALVLEEKTRQVAGEARVVYGEAAEHAQEARQTLSRSVRSQPFAAVLIAAATGFAAAWFSPRR